MAFAQLLTFTSITQVKKEPVLIKAQELLKLKIPNEYSKPERIHCQGILWKDREKKSYRFEKEIIWRADTPAEMEKLFWRYSGTFPLSKPYSSQNCQRSAAYNASPLQLYKRKLAAAREAYRLEFLMHRPTKISHYWWFYRT